MFPARKIKNIIFDLGGVLLNLDYNLTEKAFQKLGIKDFNSLYNQFDQNSFFSDYETGKISSQQFREGLKKHLPDSVTNGQIDDAWNAMLLEMPKAHIDLLFELKKHFNIYLYSNTNEIHILNFRAYLDKEFGIGLFDKLFINHYYSNELGMRKPHSESFTKVLELENLKASETFFIDDSPQHLEGAKKAGLQTHYLNLKVGESVLDVFKEYC